MQDLIDLVFKSLQEVRENEFEEKRCAAMAACSLEIMGKLASVLADAEFQAKQAKNNLDLIVGERSIEIREEASDGKKPTDKTIESMVAKDSKVRDAKTAFAEAEKEFKKWQYIYNTVRESHVFFRGLDKQKTLF